jgi:hypothetical protein
LGTAGIFSLIPAPAPPTLKAPRRLHPAIEGLRWAGLSDPPEAFASEKATQSSGARMGKAFEKSFGRGLHYALKELKRTKGLQGELYSEQWIKFEDQRGPGGLVQIDHFVVFPAGVVAFECKLRESVEAYPQLMRYGPLLKHIFARPVRMVAVFRILTGATERPPEVSSVWECLVEGAALRSWHVPNREFVLALPRLPRRRRSDEEDLSNGTA